MAETIFTPPGIEVHRKIADYLHLDKGYIDRDGFTVEDDERGKHRLRWRSIRLVTAQEMADIMKKKTDYEGFVIEPAEQGKHLLRWNGVRSLTKQEMTDIMKIINAGDDLG